MRDKAGAAEEPRVWWKLKRSRRYVADWRANAGTAAPFWSGVRVLDGVAEPGDDAEGSPAELARKAGAAVLGLRLPDGSLILRVSRARREEQVRIVDGASFDAAESRFAMWIAVDSRYKETLGERENLWAIFQPPRRHSGR